MTPYSNTTALLRRLDPRNYVDFTIGDAVAGACINGPVRKDGLLYLSYFLLRYGYIGPDDRHYTASA